MSAATVFAKFKSSKECFSRSSRQNGSPSIDSILPKSSVVMTLMNLATTKSCHLVATGSLRPFSALFDMAKIFVNAEPSLKCVDVAIDPLLPKPSVQWMPFWGSPFYNDGSLLFLELSTFFSFLSLFGVKGRFNRGSPFIRGRSIDGKAGEENRLISHITLYIFAYIRHNL